MNRIKELVELINHYPEVHRMFLLPECVEQGKMSQRDFEIEVWQFNCEYIESRRNKIPSWLNEIISLGWMRFVMRQLSFSLQTISSGIDDIDQNNDNALEVYYSVVNLEEIFSLAVLNLNGLPKIEGIEYGELKRSIAAATLAHESESVDEDAKKQLLIASKLIDALPYANEIQVKTLDSIECLDGFGVSFHQEMLAQLKTLDLNWFERKKFSGVIGDESRKTDWLNALVGKGVLEHNGKNTKGSAYRKIL